MDTGNLLATVIIFTCGWVAVLLQGDPRLLPLEGSVRGGTPTAAAPHCSFLLGWAQLYVLTRADSLLYVFSLRFTPPGSRYFTYSSVAVCAFLGWYSRRINQ
jgi:hypothetical protein